MTNEERYVVTGVNGSYLQLPCWKDWGLSIPMPLGKSDADFERLVFLQNTVAGVLMCDPDKARKYLSGELHYYAIVEEIEVFVGRRLCGKGAA